MRFYIINLPAAAERRQRMEAMVRSCGFDFQIVSAVEGMGLSAAEIDVLRWERKRMLHPAEHGCLLSHLKAWQLFHDSGEEAAVICEDDINVSSDFATFLTSFSMAADRICLVRLETFLASVTVQREPLARVGRYGVHQLFTAHGGTGIYLINRRTARFLIDHADRMRLAIDIELFSPDRRHLPPFDVFQVIPAPCIQDHFLTSHDPQGFLASSMGQRRSDAGLWGPSHWLLDRLKDMLRPAYRVAQNVVLRPRRLWRVRVQFG